jgi:hypothetical protein
MKAVGSTPVDILQTGLEEVNDINTREQIINACSFPLTTSLLIQHLKGAITLHDKLTDIDFLQNDLFYVLFQVYFPLWSMRDSFTHYDLHTNNILLYEPVVGSYIQYCYTIDNGESIYFRSKYIVKIIDYGRCFFEDNRNETFSGSSKKIYEAVCSTRSCYPRCGEEAGFEWLKYNKNKERDRYYISSQRRNASHDLRALYMISQMSYDDYLKYVPNFLQDLLQKVYYRSRYGTPESSDGFPTRINNVFDAASYMFNLILPTRFIPENFQHYDDESKRLGNLFIYSNREMIYEKKL